MASHPLRTRLSSALALAGLALASLAASVTAAPSAEAAVPASGSTTTVPYTPGKAQGSNKWGLIGDVETYDGTTTMSYGVQFNPVDGSMWVSDSGKVLSSSTLCSLLYGKTSPCQTGTSRVFRYAADQTAAGAATGYTGNGTYEALTAANNDGFGKFFAPRTARQVFQDPAFSGNPVLHGPRGIEFSPDGTAWIADAEAVAPLGGPAGMIKRFDPSGGLLSGAGYSGTWAQKNELGVHWYPVDVARTPENTILAPSVTSDRLQEYALDGTSLRNIPLDNPVFAPGVTNPQAPNNGVNYRNPYTVAVDRADGSRYIGLSDFKYAPNTAVQPYVEKRNADNVVIQNIGQGHFIPGQTIFGTSVNNIPGTPTYRHLFAWSQSANAVQEFDENGAFVRQWTSGSTAAANAQPGSQTGAAPGGDRTVAVPGLTVPRDVAFDSRGFMYMTVAEGTANTKVLAFGMTPAPVTSVCSDRSDDGTSVRLDWSCDTAPASPAVQDYTVEMSSDGGATWQLVPHAASAAKSRTVTGLDPSKTYSFRVAAWNEAGNGDWGSVTVPPKTVYANDAGTLTFEDGQAVPSESDPMPIDVVANDANSAGKTVKLLDANGTPADTVTVPGEGTYTVTDGTKVSFTPDSGYEGTSSVRYVLTDPSQGTDVRPCDTSAFGTLTMKVLQRSTTPGLSLTKTGEFAQTGTHKAGDTVNYTFTVKNTGKSDLTDVAVTDDRVSSVDYAWPGAPGSLAVGQSVTATASYTLTQADVDEGSVTNVASASGRNAKGVSAAAEASATLGIDSDSAASLAKTGVFTGEKIEWTVTMTNTGNVSLSQVQLQDLLAGTAPLQLAWPAGSTPGTLAPGATLTATTSSPASRGAEDVTVTNNATASAQTPKSGPVGPLTAAASVTVPKKDPEPSPTPSATATPKPTPSGPSTGPVTPSPAPSSTPKPSSAPQPTRSPAASPAPSQEAPAPQQSSPAAATPSPEASPKKPGLAYTGTALAVLAALALGLAAVVIGITVLTRRRREEQ